MAQSARQDLFEAFKTIYTADANKLGGGTVDKGVREFLMEGADVANRPLPHVFIELTETDQMSISTDNRSIIVAFHIRTEPDRTVNEQEVISEQIRSTYDGVSITGTDWTWGIPNYMGSDFASEIGGTPVERHLVVRFRVFGTRGASLNAPLIGATAAITFARGSGGEEITVGDLSFFETNAGVELEEFRYLGDRWSNVGPAESSGSFVLIQRVRSGFTIYPTIPLGIMGTLTVNKNEEGYGISGPAMLSRRRHTGSMDGWQTYQYTGRWSGAWTEVNALG